MKVHDISKEEQGMPGMNSSGKAYSNYNVKYAKISMDAPGDVAFLESLETKAIQDNDNLMILSFDKFTYESEYYLIVKYLEKKGQSSFGKPMPEDDTDSKEPQTKKYEI